MLPVTPFATDHQPRACWCTGCGARPGIAGPAWIGRICVARSSRLADRATVRNTSRGPLPAGIPRARDSYRVAGLCVQCGRRRDRADRLTCKRCRRRMADATARHRTAHPPDRERLNADARERRRQRIAAGRCAADANGTEPDSAHVRLA